MNLTQSINIYAGGLGSGPNAPCPQCGPHGKEESGEKFKGPKGGPSPEIHKEAGVPLITKTKEQKKSLPSKLYEKHIQKQTVIEKHTAKSASGTTIKEGDTVKNKTEVKLWNQKTGDVDRIHPGSKLTVSNVLPKIGTGSQMISVVTKNHDPEYMQAKDVDLHKTAPTPNIEVEPVKKSQVISKFKTADGADVTWVKPHVEGEKEQKDITERAHYQKGNFSLIDRVEGIQDRPGYTRVTRIYDTSGMPAHLQKGAGTTLWVDSYTQKGKIKEVVINEQNYTTYAQKTRGALTFSYKKGFGEGAAKAVGMLKTRYGIKTTLARLRN